MPTTTVTLSNVRNVPTSASRKYRNERCEEYNMLANLTHEMAVSDEAADLVTEWQEIVQHVDFRRHAFIFSVCDELSCQWAQCRKVVPCAPKWARVRALFGGTAPAPSPSDTHPGHYLTFLEQMRLAEEGQVFPPGDYHCPSVAQRDGGVTAMFCNRSEHPCSKHWTYSSKSAGERHDKTLHWEERRSRQRVAPGAKYVIPCQDCRHTFESVGLLKRHYNNSRHETSIPVLGETAFDDHSEEDNGATGATQAGTAKTETGRACTQARCGEVETIKADPDTPYCAPAAYTVGRRCGFMLDSPAQRRPEQHA